MAYDIDFLKPRFIIHTGHLFPLVSPEMFIEDEIRWYLNSMKRRKEEDRAFEAHMTKRKEEYENQREIQRIRDSVQEKTREKMRIWENIRKNLEEFNESD